jgi:hypothetical protein
MVPIPEVEIHLGSIVIMGVALRGERILAPICVAVGAIPDANYGGCNPGSDNTWWYGDYDCAAGVKHGTTAMCGNGPQTLTTILPVK